MENTLPERLGNMKERENADEGENMSWMLNVLMWIVDYVMQVTHRWDVSVFLSVTYW